MYGCEAAVSVKNRKRIATIVTALALTAKRTVLKQAQIRGAYIGEEQAAQWACRPDLFVFSG